MNTCTSHLTINKQSDLLAPMESVGKILRKGINPISFAPESYGINDVSDHLYSYYTLKKNTLTFILFGNEIKLKIEKNIDT